MARRKKRILFDVMGSGKSGKSARKPAGRSNSRRMPSPVKKPRPTRQPVESDAAAGSFGSGGFGEGEFRITTNLAAALGVAFVVFMALSYYFGFAQGSRGDESPDSNTQIRRDVQEGDRHGLAGGGPVHAVRACIESYTQYSFSSMLEEMKLRARYLRGEGFEVDLRDYSSGKNDGKGVLKLWVGESSDSESLRRVAAALRPLSGPEGRQPFAAAIPVEKR